jgi:predicted RecB family nuclease
MNNTSTPTSTDMTRRTPRAGLSKSRFLLGAQCHRLLWLKAHEPDASELHHDAATELVLHQGHLVGEEARRRFPGGVLVDLAHDDIDGRLARTQELLDAGTDIIFEASFRALGVFVAVDVLRRTERGAWEILEVKSSTKVKDEHMLDVAVQRIVLRAAGLDIERATLMHLDRACAHPETDNLLAFADLTDDAVGLEPWVADEVAAQLAILAEADAPEVAPGDHCDEPRRCPFFDRCHASLPEHHVTTLYRIGARAPSLVAQGYNTVGDLAGTAAAAALSDVARRQVRAVRANGIVIEDGLGAALAKISEPIAFLDFETVAFAIPRFEGARPWDSIAAQASVHIVDGERTEHKAWIADGSDDPRAAIGAFIIDATRGARTILAWNASFEVHRLREIAEAVPLLAPDIDAVIERIVDLLPIVRSHVYHPDFGGSFSLKSVAPALAPGLSYADLEIASGDDAAAALFALFDDATDAGERERLRGALLAYCARDTEALVAVFRTLSNLGASGARAST